MPKYFARDHRMVPLVQWNPDEPAIRINDHILMSCGSSNSYVVTGDDGDVVINTGMPAEGARGRERFEQMLGRPLDVRKIVITQSHPDHFGGWADFAGSDTEIICQRDFEWFSAERIRLGAFYGTRLHRAIAALSDEKLRTAWHKGAAPITNPTYFAERLDFEVSGRAYSIISTPSGEALDCTVVWMPAERTLFTGNLMGAIQDALPHFYTLRGDRDRSLVRFVQDMNKLLALEPALLITGHGPPIEGADRVKAYLTKLRDATQYIWDYTLDGMNAGKDLFTLMREVRLPPELQHGPGRGPVSWYVRAAWEEVAGWFRMESTTELYPVPPSAIWTDLAELAGAESLIERAKMHLAAGNPVHALHFVDIVRKADPGNQAALETEIAAIDQLIEAGRGENLDEQGWLESERARATKQLGEPTS